MLKVNFSPPLMVGILEVIIFTHVDISFFTFFKKHFTCNMQPYIFTGYDEEKLEDKHLCKSLYFIKPLVTSLTRIDPTSEKH
jgi:hypothetical protein